MRGWPIKPAALMASTLKEVLFLDADCLPLRNPELLLDSAEYRARRALFWPDWRVHRLVEGARVWELVGLPYRGDAELETGIFLVDKESCWRELGIVQWMNAHSSFWYRHVLGDKDTFYIAWRKLGRSYHLAPPGTRYRSVVLRHLWEDGEPIADHRTGTSKYALPVRRGPYTSYLSSYEGRPMIKNLYDEIMQRFFVRDFPRHVSLLEELARVRDECGPG
jgi:hypothetical protein